MITVSTDSGQRERPAPLVVLALCLCVVAVSYAGALDIGFVWDDHTLIVRDEGVHSLGSAMESFTRALWDVPLNRSVPAYYRPLVRLAYAADWTLADGAAWFFHLGNLFWHLLVCALVFVLARSLGARAPAAGLAAALFGVFPRLTESVSWISGRTDLMAMAFGLLALVLERRGPPTVARRVGVALALLAALLSKEVALCVLGPLVVWSVARARRERSPLKAEVLAALPVLVAVAGYFAARAVVLTSARPLTLASPATWLAAWGTYLRMVVTPWLPAAQIGCVTETPAWAMAAGVVGLCLVAALVWALRTDGARLGLLAGAEVALLLPTLPVLGLSALAADRFLYAPLALGAVLVAVSLPRRAAVLAAGGAVVVALALVTNAHNAVWRSPLALAAHTVANAERCNPSAAQVMGDALADEHRLSEALAWYQAAERRWGSRPDSPTRLSVAATLSQQGEDGAALALTEALVAANPSWRRAALDLALFRLRASDVEGARAALATLTTRTGEDEASRSLDALISAESAPLGDEAALAGRYDRLGSIGHALPLFRKLAEAPDAQVRRRAQGWLLIHAERPLAEQALSALLASPGLTAEETQAYRAIFEERFGVEVPDGASW